MTVVHKRKYKSVLNDPAFGRIKKEAQEKGVNYLYVWNSTTKCGLREWAVSWTWDRVTCEECLKLKGK